MPPGIVACLGLSNTSAEIIVPRIMALALALRLYRLYSMYAVCRMPQFRYLLDEAPGVQVLTRTMTDHNYDGPAPGRLPAYSLHINTHVRMRMSCH